MVSKWCDSIQASSRKMNYKEAKLILDEIKSANNILVGCHRGPDMDCIGSATAVASVLEEMGKKATIVCNSKVPEDLYFLNKTKEIKQLTDFSSLDYSIYDLFIVLDSSSWQMIANNPKVEKPNLKMMVIDHHKTNDKFGDINLVDPDVTSVGELLYYVFEDWGVEINKEIAQSLLTGILGDTGIFAYPGSGRETFKVVQDLMTHGANKDEIILYTYRTRDMGLVKFIGKIVEAMEVDKQHGFVWSAIPYSVYEEYGKPESGKEVAASMFIQSVKDTDFGFILVEIDKKDYSVSFRSRTGFDISGMAVELGGGGHAAAAGARVKAESFEEAVEKVLEVSRKHAKKA